LEDVLHERAAADVAERLATALQSPVSLAGGTCCSGWTSVSIS
jgi:hypothetical protein